MQARGYVHAGNHEPNMPRYSIVITTVDRHEIFREVLAGALALQRDDIEVIVSDNFSDQRTQTVVDEFDDPRLRKFRTDHRMAMPDHWNWVWEKVTGDFVIYTCDDSIVTEAALKVADHAIDNYDAAIVSWRSAQYYHPDWNVRFRHLPDRGNILAIDMGFSNGLFRVNTDAVIRHFCETLRLSACFPSVVGFLVKREIGQAVADETGKFHWAPCPDISASLMALTRAGEGNYFYWDGIGAIGGRSGDSNIAGILSKGAASGRVTEFIEEFSDNDEIFPDHDVRLHTITNFLAPAITQAKRQFPDRFPDYQCDLKTIVMRSIDDSYRDRTVPWADDPAFGEQLDNLVETLPSGDREEARESLRSARQELAAFQASGEEHFNPTPLPASGTLTDLVTGLWNSDGRMRRLFTKTMRNPAKRYWEYAGSTFIDMDLFGTKTIRGVPKALPLILAEFELEQSPFLAQYRDLGMLNEPVDVLDFR